MVRALVLTAAGSSTRMGGTVKKEYLPLEESSTGIISVLSSSLFTFLSTHSFNYILITIPKGGARLARKTIDADGRIAEALASQGLTLLFTEGGSTRQESVRCGLVALETLSLHATLSSHASANPIDTVLIHDAARPWVSAETIQTVIAATEKTGAAVPGIPSVDTQKEIDETGKIIRHLDRSRLVSVQTPQGFRFAELLEAHRKATDDGKEYTDDTEIWGRYAGDVQVVAGTRENKKITYQGDL